MHMPHCCIKYSSNSWGFHGKVFFTFKLMSRSGILVQKSLKMPLFMKNREIGKNREIFWNDLKIHFRSFVILKMHFPVKFRPYISIFDKVTALLILWEFDRGFDGKFHNDDTGRSRDWLIILALLKKIRKIDF